MGRDRSGDAGGVSSSLRDCELSLSSLENLGLSTKWLSTLAISFGCVSMSDNMDVCWTASARGLM